jgi:acetolactate synthase-1/2/3 large subunit
LIEKNHHPKWHKKFDDLYTIEHKEVIDAQENPTQGGITMTEVLKSLNEITKGEAVLVSDVGQHQMITSRYGEFKHSKSKITSGGLGTMGFALPAAIGAKMGAPEREVIAIIGDGSFQMNIQELGTVLQTKVPVKILILNNEFLGMVRQWQELFFDKRYASTVMTNPDFVKIAEGYGLNAHRVTKREDIYKGIADMIVSDGSYLLEVVVEKEGNVFPMVPSGASVSDIRLK